MTRENMPKYLEYACILFTVILTIAMNLSKKIFPYISIIYATGAVIIFLRVIRYQLQRQPKQVRVYVIILIIYITALYYLFMKIF